MSAVRRTLVRRLGWGVLLAGLLAWPAARLVDVLYGTDVTLMSRLRSEKERASWRISGWRPRHGLAALYGVVDGRGAVRVLLSEEDAVRPVPEEPGLILLLLDPKRPAPLTCRSFRFQAAMIGLALGLLGALLLVRERRLARGA